jgi:hypothetical protein
MSSRSVGGFAVVLALTMGFVGCGGGTPGNGNGDTMSVAERTAAMGAVADYRETLGPSSGPATAQALATYLGTRPEFEASGVSDTGDAWGRFTDGRLAILICTDDPADDVATEAAGVGIRAQRSGVPANKPARILRSMGTAFPNCVPDLLNWLGQAGYTNAGGTATIASLKTVSGDGVFYLHGHGGAGSVRAGAAPAYALWVLDDYTAANEAAFAADLGTGAVCYMLARQDKDQPAVWHYAITDEFVTQYMSFGKNSFVLIHGCNGNSASAATFKAACFAKGASLYAGWTDVVMSNDSSRASRFVIDRMLGANLYSPKESPKQRPFDYQAVWTDLTSRGWDTSHAEGHGTAKFTFSTKSGSDCGILAPSIEFITLYEAPFHDTAKTKMELAGLFGDDPGDSKRTVTVGGTKVDVTEWAADKVTCDIPNFGEGSVGDVVVEVASHRSNKVPISEWTIPFTYTWHWYGSLTDTIHLRLHLRADVHKFRERPGATPITPSAVLVQSMADSDGDWTSGGSGHLENDGNAASITWSGSGVLTGTDPQSTQGGVGADGWIDVQSMTLYVMLWTFADQKQVDAVYPGGYTSSATELISTTLLPVYDEIDTGRQLLRIPLTSDFGIEEGSREAPDPPEFQSATLEWQAAPVSYAPIESVHASRQ